MLKVLEEIFDSATLETDDNGGRVELQSHTPKEQGVFLQQLYDQVRPSRSLEVGFAYGISTLFILEKCRQYNGDYKCHIVIEPQSWGPAAMYNITKAGLEKYIDIRSDYSDRVLPSMYLMNERIQFAYVDTTKLFDTVLQDFYFIDKILDIGGVIIMDDAETDGVNMVVRFINTLPNYQVVSRFGREDFSKKYKLAQRFLEIVLSWVPFRNKFMSQYSFKTSRQLGLDYRCIAFKKISNDAREWNWYKPF